jgi:hypothetical protein
MKLTPVSAYHPKPGEQPVFSIRKKFWLGETCYVVAEWRDGTVTKVRRFDDRLGAEYWLKTESGQWLENFRRQAAA